jgi:hypothetical protein
VTARDHGEPDFMSGGIGSWLGDDVGERRVDASDGVRSPEVADEGATGAVIFLFVLSFQDVIVVLLVVLLAVEANESEGCRTTAKEQRRVIGTSRVRLALDQVVVTVIGVHGFLRVGEHRPRTPDP